MPSLSAPLRAIVRLYIKLAGVHVLFKIAKFAYRMYIRQVVWAHIPGPNFDITLTEQRKNLHRLHDWRTERILSFKGAELVKMGDYGVVCVTPEAVKWMLKTEFAKVTKPGPQDLFFFNLRRFIGNNGIFTLRHGSGNAVKAENDVWFHQRKTASLIFTKNKFNSLMSDTFEEKAQLFLQVCAEAAETNQVMDIQSKFFAFTIDSIQNIFFGRKVDTITKGEADKFSHAFDEAHRCMISMLHNSIPAYLVARLFLPFPFGDTANEINTSLVVNQYLFKKQEAKDFEYHAKELNDLAATLVSEARKDKDLEKRRDLLALFITSKMEFSDQDLKDIILNLTIAGRDTTACALTWMTYILTQNPEVEKELLKEIDTVLGGRQPTLADIHPDKMPYLNGVLFEALRLFPPVPFDGKVVAEDVKYLDGTHVPKGVRLFFSPYLMGRNPEMYENPLKVDPTRWIPFKMPDPYEFPVFQAGPRFCLGKDMAQFEAKFLIASLYQKFTFKLLDGEAEKITYSRSLTMNLCNSKQQDSHELLVIPQKRN